MTAAYLDDAPGADDVARAVVAAAAVTGEDPMTLPGPDGRFKLAALQALRLVFPSTAWPELGRMVAVPKPVAALHQVKKQPWWPEQGAAATEAALSALEGGRT